MARGFYTDSHGRHRPISQSLYRPAKDKVLAERISIVNPSQARDSVHYLNQRYDNADSRTERVKLVKAANSAANRAKVASQNSRNSESERRQMAEVSEVYRGFVDSHKGKE